MILTIDIGNSRIKWALWQAEVIVARGVSDYDVKNSAAGFDELFSSVEKPARVFAVCVAGERVRQSLSEWVKQRWQLDVEYLKTQKQYKNIINAYPDPEQYGADRWAAVVAAHQSFPASPVCVISAGTAITIDLIDKKGRHLGGYILPSYASMHAALLADTANVSSTFNIRPDEQNVPDNTDDAVNQGLHKLLQAGIREFCRSSQDRLGESVQVILTGGFAKVIMAYPDMPVMHHKPDLIMQGLYDIMKQQESGGGS